jgi:hypothetical protein
MIRITKENVGTRTLTGDASIFFYITYRHVFLHVGATEIRNLYCKNKTQIPLTASPQG